MWDKKIYQTAYFKKMLPIGIAVLVGIVLALIILRMEKTTVKDLVALSSGDLTKALHFIIDHTSKPL